MSIGVTSFAGKLLAPTCTQCIMLGFELWGCSRFVDTRTVGRLFLHTPDTNSQCDKHTGGTAHHTNKYDEQIK